MHFPSDNNYPFYKTRGVIIAVIFREKILWFGFGMVFKRVRISRQCGPGWLWICRKIFSRLAVWPDRLQRQGACVAVTVLVV